MEDKIIVAKTKVLVVGGTGNVGKEVVRDLVKKGEHVIVGTRRPNEYPKIYPDCNPVKFDYSDPSTFEKALEGVNRIFMISPPMDWEADKKIKPFINIAVEKGIEHLVYLSAFGVDKNDDNPQRKTELDIINSGITYTILRPNFFMENFSVGFVGPMIKYTKGIYLPAEDSKTSFISIKDIAEVAATCLTDETHHFKAYNLTGPEALSHAVVASILSDQTGEKITYNSIDEQSMRKDLIDKGLTEKSVDYMEMLYRGVRSGAVAGLTNEVEKILGRAPTTFEQFAKDNAGVLLEV